MDSLEMPSGCGEGTCASRSPRRAPAEGAEENLHPQILIFSSAPQEAEPNGQPPSYPLRVAFPAKSGNSLDHTRQQKARERLTGLVCSRGALQEN